MKTTLVPGLDVPALTRDASLIVVGQVISIQEEERGRYEIRGIVMSARRMKAFFRVDRVLKGEAGAELSFSFFLTDQFAGYAGVAADQSGLFFLRPAPEGLVFASPWFAAARLPRNPSGKLRRMVRTRSSA